MNGKQRPQPEIYQRPRATATGSSGSELVMRRLAPGFSIEQCDVAELAHFIGLVVGHGDLCSFSLTSDGGALCLCVLQGGRQYKSYARSADELLVRMTDLWEKLY